MKGFGAWMISSPVRTAAIAGMLFAVVFGIVSFPREDEITKTLDEWAPQNASDNDEVIAELETALATAREQQNLRRVSQDRFESLDLPLAYAFVETNEDAGQFTIRYVGKESGSDEVYVAEREVYPGPWWSPSRLVYKALGAQAEELENVLVLSFRRDWEGLFGLLLVDATIGLLYGTIVGLILSVLGSKKLNVPGQGQRVLPPETPVSALRGGARISSPPRRST